MTSSVVLCSAFENIEWKSFEINDTSQQPIKVFFVKTTQHSYLLSSYQDILSNNEINRSYSYHHTPKREQHLINKCLLKILLGAYLGKSYDAIQLLPGRNGKPEVINQSALHYSVSYSSDYMLLAVAPDDIGVDVECVRYNFHFQDIVDFSFSPKEKDFIKQNADPTNAFYTLWTRKEALVKATAQGINDDFHNTPSLNGSHLIDQTKLATSLDWITSSFIIGTDCMAAISCPSRFNSKDIAFYIVDTIPSALYTPSNQLTSTCF